MIDPKELRIGNLVQFDNDSSVFAVSEINATGVEVYNQYEETWIELDQFSPIPLTPEWLERLGFERNLVDNYWIDNQFFVSIHNLRDVIHYNFSVYMGDDNEPFGLEVKSVHQLQNLYHALTGQELTVKELTPTL